MKKFDGMLILSDMDGTILDDNKQISEENIKAIQYFVDNGGRFSLATGRSKTSMEYYVQHLPINAPVVVYNGAGVYDFKADRFVFTKCMDDSCVAFINDICQKFPFVAGEVYLEATEFVVNGNEITDWHFKQIRLPMIEKKAEEIPLPWVKINFCIPEEKMDEVEAYAREYHKNWFYQRSGRRFFEAMSLGLDKGTGALEVCKAENIDPKYLFTIGDHLNDIELIEAAGISFCPANSQDKIKEMADVIVTDNNNHALASMIEWLDKKF